MITILDYSVSLSSIENEENYHLSCEKKHSHFFRQFFGTKKNRQLNVWSTVNFNYGTMGDYLNLGKNPLDQYVPTEGASKFSNAVGPLTNFEKYPQ